jgi:hypothetical protein
MYVFDLVGRMWTHLSPKGLDPEPRRYHGGAIVGTRMVIYGGQNYKGQTLNDYAILDLERMAWVDVVREEHHK